MLKQIRRPSPALVISVIALFAALGGTVYAGSKISGKMIKVKSLPGNRLQVGSLPGNRLKADTVTGAQVNESTLAQVPSAATAANADNATKVNGHTAECRAGTQPFAGGCWESAARAAVTEPVAAATCNELGGTLPRAFELVSFSKMVTLGGTDEWSDDINTVTGLGAYTVITVSKEGKVNTDAPTDTKEYRCVLPLVR